MGLFKPGWMSKDEDKALRALDKVSSDDELFKVAIECPHRSVQLRATSKIRDANRRLDVALTRRLIDLDVRKAALAGAAEEGLCQVANQAPTSDIRLEAVSLMSDDALLAEVVAASVGGNLDDKRVCEAAYEKMAHPPFECSMLMHGKKADENLVRELDGMTYPADRDKLLRVARERDGEPAEWAVAALPYERERNVLRKLAMSGKGLARSAAIASLRLPADRDIVDAILTDEKTSAILKQRAARLLPDDDPTLDQRVCPHCGAFDSVYQHGGYDGSADLNYSAYECRECGHESKQWDYIGPAEDFSVTLRELRNG